MDWWLAPDLNISDSFVLVRPTQHQHTFSGVSYRRTLKVWKFDLQIHATFFDSGHTFIELDCLCRV